MITVEELAPTAKYEDRNTQWLLMKKYSVYIYY